MGERRTVFGVRQFISLFLGRIDFTYVREAGHLNRKSSWNP
jgi:hypothetical protein